MPAERRSTGNVSPDASVPRAGSGPATEPEDRWSSLAMRDFEPDAVLALMFAIAGTLDVLYMAMPHWRVAYPAVILGAGFAALAFAPVVWLSGRRIGPCGRHIELGVGTVATSVAVFGVGAGPSSMSTAYFYFWIVLFAAAYFSPVAAVGHLAFAGVAYSFALAFNFMPEFLSQWMLAMAALMVIVLFLGVFASKVRRGADALTFQTLHDGLTGLANRALFLDRVDEALSSPRGKGDQVAVLYLDIDDFKVVNDSLGDQAGDCLLTAFASSLGSLTAAGDTLARLGGDEFAILLESGPQPQTAKGLAERIAKMLRTPFQLGDTEVTLSVSVGISVAEPSGNTGEEVIRKADLAMYLAKRNGRGRFEVVRPGMLDDSLKRLALITDLRHALDDSQFEVFYQPIVGARDARPTGAEALVRWHHPHRGLVTPDKLIAAAESTGLIVAIGDWVLNEACLQAQAWRQDRTTDDDFYVSVNLSPRQLAEPAVIDDVAAALRRSGLPPRALVLEVTETSIMPDYRAGLARLKALRSLGVRIAVDDFGTGYSSLNRLKDLPVDIIKIDKSFIDHIVGADQDRALVEGIINVTHALGMISIAEGVEGPDQYSALQKLGCDGIQGYHFAKPAAGVSTARTLQRLAGAASPDPGIDGPEGLPASGLTDRTASRRGHTARA